MIIRSTLAGLLVSLSAALALGAFAMPPVTGAQAAQTAAQCEGYARLTLLLATSSEADGFSKRHCVRALRAGPRNN